MITSKVQAQDREIDWNFLTVTLRHHDIPHRAAIVQNVSLNEPEYGDNYHVLLQSNDALQRFVMYKCDQKWEADDANVSQEIVMLLGQEIDKG